MTGDNHSDRVVTSPLCSDSSELTKIAVTLLDFVNVAGDDIKATLDKSAPARRYVDHRKYLQKQLKLFTPPEQRNLPQRSNEMLHVHLDSFISTDDLRRNPGDLIMDNHSSRGGNELECMSEQNNGGDITDNVCTAITCRGGCKSSSKTSFTEKTGSNFNSTVKDTLANEMNIKPNCGKSFTKKANFDIKLKDTLTERRNIESNKLKTMSNLNQNDSEYGEKRKDIDFIDVTSMASENESSFSDLFENSGVVTVSETAEESVKKTTVPLRQRQLPASFWQEPKNRSNLPVGSKAYLDYPFVYRDSLTQQYISQFYGTNCYPVNNGLDISGCMDRYHAMMVGQQQSGISMNSNIGIFSNLLTSLHNERTLHNNMSLQAERIAQLNRAIAVRQHNNSMLLANHINSQAFKSSQFQKDVTFHNSESMSYACCPINGIPSERQSFYCNIGTGNKDPFHSVGYPSPEVILAHKPSLFKPVPTKTLLPYRYHPYGHVRNS